MIFDFFFVIIIHDLWTYFYHSILHKHPYYKLYHENIFNDYWKINPVGDFISNFNYPIIHPKKDEIVKKLIENN